MLKNKIGIMLICMTMIFANAISFSFGLDEDITSDELVNTEANQPTIEEEQTQETISEEIGKLLTVVRLFGQTAYGTSSNTMDFAVSSKAGNLLKPDDQGNTYVFLCNGEAFPDALGASALAAYYNAPILLTKSSSLPSETKNVLEKLKPSKIIVIGGNLVVPDFICKDAMAAAGISQETPIDRIWGETKYDTSREIYLRGKELGAWGTGRTKTCILASAKGFQDSLSISPYAYSNQAPLFLVDENTKEISNKMAKDIIDGRFDQMIIVGGNLVVSDEVINQTGIKKVVRLGGETGYDTSLIVAKWACGQDVGDYKSTHFLPTNKLDVKNGIAFASGVDFPDGLVVGILQGAIEGPTVLVKNNDTTVSNIANWLKSEDEYLTTMHILGGSSVMPSKLGKALIEMTSYDSIEWKPSGVERFSGVKPNNRISEN